MTDEAMEVRNASAGYAPQVESPAVPEGYKQTEVGVIPEDWRVVPLSHTAERVTRGASPRPIDSPVWFDSNSSVGWVRISDVTRSGRLLLETTQKLSRAGVHNSRPVPAGSLIMSICATVGRPIETRLDVCIHDGFVVFDQPKVDQSFLYHVLVALEPTWSKHGQTGSQMNLNTGIINSCLVPLPPSEDEQGAIATALGDVDSLLESLDRLIAKKRDIKQATMQQLLTGETRLPGFEGEWRSVRLGDHVTFLKNGTHSRAELMDSGEVRYLHYGDIHAADAATLNPVALPFLPSDNAKSLGRLNDGDVIFADASEDIEGVGSSVELVNVGDVEVVAGLHTIAARFEKSVLADGFKAYLQFCPEFISSLRRLAAGTKVYATTRSHISGIEMRLPSVEEQRAIAATLKNMDIELDALEQRRAKTAALKQAMMQELLTGRTRLV